MANGGQTGSPSASKPIRVLFVDDEQDISAVMARGLRAKGFEVDAFTDPAKALRDFRPDHYSFVVTDIRMPHMDGFGLYRKIREQDPKVKFYFLTAIETFEEKELKENCGDDPLVAFLKKPISYSTLADKLTKSQISTG